MNYCAEAVKISVGLLLQLDGWVVSTKEQPSVLATDVFPNPTSGKLNIRYSDGTRIDNLNYRLMNSLGQVVQAGIAGNSIDMHYLPEGIYFCSLNNNTQIKTFKVLKF